MVRKDIEIEDLWDRLPPVLKYSTGSVLYGYIGAHDDEIAAVENDLDYIIESHQLDHATGEDLDEIGSFYGVLGRRNGRNDTQYRQYLKTLSKSFEGKGTIPSIKFALSGGLNIDKSDITIEEHYSALENSIYISDWEPHETDIVYDMFEISKPSVVQLRKPVHYQVEGSGGHTVTVSSSGATTGSKDKGLGAGTIDDNYIGYYNSN